MEKIEQPNDFSESIEGLEAIAVQALNEALRAHDVLGEAGQDEVQKNIHGETALRADIECEEAVLSVLKAAGIPIKVFSEEHGQVDIISHPRYLGVLDGLDGSSVYKKERGVGRYATMFGIFNNTDPQYKDFLVSGIMEHATKRLFLAHKGGGAFLIEGGVKTSIHTSGRTGLETGVNIYIDNYFEVCRDVFESKLGEFKNSSRNFSTGSSAIAYADVASGAADMSLECTRKGNLEIAAMYGLVTEAGGAVVDINGISLSDKKYLEFGQSKEEYLPVITAATSDLANDLLEYLRGKN